MSDNISNIVFSAAKFVKLENSDESSIVWWPGLVATCWKELMSMLCPRRKALASISYMAIDKEKRNSDDRWIYLLGEHSPRDRLMMLDEARLSDTILDFYDNLDTMCERYSTSESWNNSCEEMSHWIEYQNQESSKILIPSQDVVVTNIPTEASRFLENIEINEDVRLETDDLLHSKNITTSKSSPSVTSRYEKTSLSANHSGSSGKSRVVTSISTTPRLLKGHVDESKEVLLLASQKGSKGRSGNVKRLKTSLPTSTNKIKKQKETTEATPDFINPYARNGCNRQEALLFAHSSTKKPISPPRNSSNVIKKSTSKKINTKTLGTEAGVNAKKVSPSDISKNLFSSLDKKYFPKNEEFDTVLQTLKDQYGWRVIDGNKSSLVKQYYVTGRHANSSIHHIQNFLTLNEDYFISKDALKGFLHNKVGWCGPTPLKTSPPAVEPTDIAKDLPFALVWEILQSKYGFHYRSGSNNFWNCTSKGRPLAELKAKEDYFEMEDDLKTYVHKKFGWVGPKGKEFYPIPTEGRANRRKRNHDNEAKIEKGNSSASQSVSKINLRNSLSKEAIVDDDSTKRLSVSKKRKAHASTVPVSATQHKSSEKGTNDRVAKAQMKNREADFDEIDEETTSGISTSNVKPKSSDTRISVGIPDEDYNADERNLSLKTKLENCSKSLCISNTSDDILFTGLDTSSHFSAAKDRIVSFLEKCISDNDDPKHSSVLNICGRPGTGKTTMVQHCLRCMHDSNDSPEFTSAFLNAASISSYGKLIEEIGTALGKNSNTTISAIEKRLSFKKTAPLILVVDEIDFLIGGHRQSKSKDESPIDTVFRWASNPEFALTLICISNSVGDENAKLLHKMVKVGEEVIFRTYTEADLISIIKRRLGIHTSLVDPRAMTFIARKVAKLDGDARLVLDLMSSSIIKAKETLSPELLEQNLTDKPVVNLPHVMKAIKTSGAIPLVDHINALPSKAKTILAIATTLGQVSSSWSIIRLNQLKKYCAEATRHEIFDELSTEGFYSIIGQLEDAGLIISADSDDVVRDIGYDDPGEKPIRVGVQMDDVEIALEKTLFAEGSFYTKLRDYVKSNDIENVGCSY